MFLQTNLLYKRTLTYMYILNLCKDSENSYLPTLTEIQMRIHEWFGLVLKVAPSAVSANFQLTLLGSWTTSLVSCFWFQVLLDALDDKRNTALVSLLISFFKYFFWSILTFESTLENACIIEIIPGCKLLQCLWNLQILKHTELT